MTPQSTKSLNACLLVVAVPFSCRSLHNAIVFVYYMFGSVTKTCAGAMHTISVIVENAHVEDGRLSEPRYIANLGECVNSGNIFVLFCLLL